MGRGYADHYERGRVNIWEFNDTGTWLFSDADWIELKTRGDVIRLCKLAGEPIE